MVSPTYSANQETSVFGRRSAHVLGGDTPLARFDGCPENDRTTPTAAWRPNTTYGSRRLFPNYYLVGSPSGWALGLLGSLHVNLKKTQAIFLYMMKLSHIGITELKLEGEYLTVSKEVKNLGVTMNGILSWYSYVKEVYSKVYFTLHALKLIHT